MRTIEVDDYVYNKLKSISSELQININDVISNLCGDGLFEEYYEDDLREARRNELERGERDREHWEYCRRMAREENRAWCKN